jgi:hypothetical protein
MVVQTYLFEDFLRKQMKTLFFTGIALILIALAGCITNTPPENPLDGGMPNTPSTGKLIAGASCEQDLDCVYALNAYPIQKCISPNCPSPENAQPEPNNPAYEWKQTYLDECVNNAQLNGKNVQGEDLLIDSRAASCACETIQLPGTSLDGQKICRKKMVEETPAENSGI